MNDAEALADPAFAERYRALSSRDQRFDGQFIAGVTSTGIYCRPSCPAATPKPRNVRFFVTAAAAHEAGLRACKRCLPDAVPGSPAWNVRDDVSARAMRLIADGTVEREGVPGLAAHLGYSSRQLGRILTEEVGAAPLALARAHRAQTARLLLVGTDLPVTDVAFAAGFSSIRQFNETFAEVYRMTPTDLRRRTAAPAGAARPDDGAVRLTLTLPAREPFDGAGVLRFLALHAVEGVEQGDADRFTRSLRLPHGPAVVTLRVAGTGRAALVCDAVLSDVADLAPLVARLRRLGDLDADAAAIDEALAHDPALAPRVALVPGIRVPGGVDAHETLLRTIVGQQISLAAARTALGRLTEALGDDHGLPVEDGPSRLFPTAAALAEHGREVLRGPARRIDTVVAVAGALADGSLVVDAGEPRAELERRLVALPGIGPWTAGYVAMRQLGDPDVLLTGDVALRSGARSLGLPDDRAALTAHAESWRPWRSYAGMHLWGPAIDRMLAGAPGPTPA